MKDKAATFKYKLSAKSGYTAEGEYQVTPDQYGDIIRVCEGTLTSQSFNEALELAARECDTHDYGDPFAAAIREMKVSE